MCRGGIAVILPADGALGKRLGYLVFDGGGVFMGELRLVIIAR